MRRLFEIFLVALVVVMATHFLPALDGEKPKEQENVLERVKRTKTLKCAYWLWPELIERAPNTGAMSGPIVDIVQEVAKSFGAEVQWTAEASIDSYVALVDSGKVDAVCGPIVPGPLLRPHTHFSTPVFYTSFDVYVRPGEKRFPTQESLNAPEASFVSLDGAAAGYFALTFFPKTKHGTLVATLGAGQTFLDVENNKADATISDQLTATRFLENNPGKIERLRWEEKPLITLSVTPFVTKVDDIVWANTLDHILKDLLDFGTIDKILYDHGLVAGKHYKSIAFPYRESL